MSPAKNVAAPEIEQVSISVATVAEVAVVAAPDLIRDEVPAAFVVTRPDVAADTNLAGSIIAVCREMADFKVQREVRIVENLPRSTLDKGAKHELRKLLREGTSNAGQWSIRRRRGTYARRNPQGGDGRYSFC